MSDISNSNDYLKTDDEQCKQLKNNIDYICNFTHPAKIFAPKNFMIMNIKNEIDCNNMMTKFREKCNQNKIIPSER